MIVPKESRPAQRPVDAERLTVIPIARRDGMFSGWGVRL
jgi:hypothetical protein